PVPQRITLERPPGRVAGGGVAAEAVVEYGARVGRGGHTQTARRRLLQGRLDQFRRRSLLAPPGREHHLVVRNGRVPGRLRDQPIFFEQLRCRGQLAGDQV